jgi:hypothetical protein
MTDLRRRGKRSIVPNVSPIRELLSNFAMALVDQEGLDSIVHVVSEHHHNTAGCCVLDHDHTIPKHDNLTFENELQRRGAIALNQAYETLVAKHLRNHVTEVDFRGCRHTLVRSLSLGCDELTKTDLGSALILYQ